MESLPKLSPAQNLLLRTAARRADGRAIPPGTMRGGARIKVLTALLQRGWIEPADGSHALTDAGYAAIGQQRPAQPDEVPVDTIDDLQLLEGIPVRPGSKLAALSPPVLEYRQEGPFLPGACMRAPTITIGRDHHHRHNHHRRQRDSGDGCDGHHLLFTPPETQICLARDRHRARASDGCDRLTGFLLTLRAHVRRVNLRTRHIRHSRLKITCAGWQWCPAWMNMDGTGPPSVDWWVMNPHLLTLALTTPLEQLLELPNAVRIAACAREDLQSFSTGQLQQMLVDMNAAITDAVTLAQIKHGSELVSRSEQRDLDWFIEVTNQSEWLRLRSATAKDRDYFRVLALYKLGEVIEATSDTPVGIIIRPAVDALMEALESLLLADLLPESPSMAQIIEEAWKAGLTPEPIAADEVRKAQSHAGRQAADARHASNRAAKQKALELFATNTYRTKEDAYRIIGAQVCKAPGTIKNWIAGLQKNTPPE